MAKKKKIKEDLSVTPEMLAAALAISDFTSKHRVYFNKDDGCILCITNEPNDTYENFVEFDSTDVSGFLDGSQSMFEYRLVFDIETSVPMFIKQYDSVDSILLTEVELTRKKDSDIGFVIKNYPDARKWVFKISPLTKTYFKSYYSLNTQVEIYVVDADNRNFLYRTFKISFADLIEKDKVIIEHVSGIECETSKIKIMTNKFFANFGYRVCYDTED